MLATLKKFLALLNASERRRFWWLQAWVAVQGLAEALSTVAVVPFILVLSDPAVVEQSRAWMAFAEATGVQTTSAMMITFGVALLGTLLLANAIRALSAYRRTMFTHDVLSTLPTRLLEGYLARDYEYFLRAGTTTLAKDILSETNDLVAEFVTPFMSAVARVVPALMVAVGVVVADWRVMAVLLVLFGVMSLGMDFATRRRQRALGIRRMKANDLRHSVVAETLRAIKEVKLFGAEAFHIRRFEPASAAFAAARARNRASSEMAGYLVESVLVGGLIALSMILLARGMRIADAAPVIALFAMALLRLLPVMTDLLKNRALFHFNTAALEHLVGQTRENAKAVQDAQRPQRVERLTLGRELVLEGVSFRYDADRPFALENISIRLPSRTTLGIVGRSGAGKSTLADLILGLLEPHAGTISIDGHRLDLSNRRAWQQSVGYVPQTINVVNASVAANIAFGIEPSVIDQDRVEAAASLAHLHTFVSSQLPQGYHTRIGEGGIALSGGQRQRIAIARALYRNPTLLVFDEATNALDPETEQAVLEAIAQLSGHMTLVLISHRHSTLSGCDAVVRMDGGRVVSEKLAASNHVLRRDTLPA